MHPGKSLLKLPVFRGLLGSLKISSTFATNRRGGLKSINPPFQTKQYFISVFSVKLSATSVVVF